MRDVVVLPVPAPARIADRPAHGLDAARVLRVQPLEDVHRHTGELRPGVGGPSNESATSLARVEPWPLSRRDDFADLVPCPPEQVRRLDELGLLDGHHEDGQFAPSAVYVVRLMGAFEEAGVPLDDVARAVAADKLTFPLFLPEPAALDETYDELGARLGRRRSCCAGSAGSSGSRRPAGDRIRDEDAEVLSLIVTTLDLADEEELSRFTRLYGGSIQRLVTAGLQFFDRAVRQRVESYDLPLEERDSIIYEKAREYTPLVSSIVPWLQRRHREHALIEYLVGVTEELLEQRGIRAVPSKQPPAIAFLDLTGYTELAEQHGDEAAADLATALAGVVNRTAQEHGGRPVKWLGDGVMFHFPDAGGAVLGGLHLLEQTEQSVRCRRGSASTPARSSSRRATSSGGR